MLAGLLSAHTALAQSPTVVYGESETAPGVWDSYLVEQPENAPNPLGNPIPVEENTDPINVAGPQTESETMHNIAPLNEINQNATQDPAPFSESPTQEQNQIENTLYEGGNRIYDVQSFPLKDIKTITEPNVDPTITTYPEY